MQDRTKRTIFYHDLGKDAKMSHDLDKSNMINHDLARLTIILASVAYLRSLGWFTLIEKRYLFAVPFK